MRRLRISTLLGLWLVTGALHARSAEVIEVRGKSDDPTKADHEGYYLGLIDPHLADGLISVSAAAPESFGKVELAVLSIIDDAGKPVGEMQLPAQSAPSTKRPPTFECSLRRDCLKNSKIALVHWGEGGPSPESQKTAEFILGTFTVRDLRDIMKTKSGAAPAPPAPRKASVALAEGVVADAEAKELIVTDKVPLIKGQFYGFRLYLRGDGTSVPCRVEQELPKPPATWGTPEMVKTLKISEDGRTASRTDVFPTEKLIEIGWMVAPGDPAGEYQIRVFAGDQLIKTFKFQVQPEPTPSPSP